MPRGDAQLVEPWRKTSQIMGAKDWKKKRYPSHKVSNTRKSRWNENQPPAEYSFKVDKVKKQNRGGQQNFSNKPNSVP